MQEPRDTMPYHLRLRFDRQTNSYRGLESYLNPGTWRSDGAWSVFYPCSAQTQHLRLYYRMYTPSALKTSY